MKVDLSGLVFIAWAIVTLGALVVAWRRADRRVGRGRRKWLPFVAAVLLWGALQFLSIYPALMIGYCESCADDPISWRDVQVAAVLFTPTALAWLVLALWRPAARNNAG